MKKNLFSAAQVCWLGFFLICCSLPLRAEQFGLFTYRVVGGVMGKITGYPKTAFGEVEIPSEIAGKPVTSVDRYAFSGCAGLTCVAIPASISSIQRDTFYGCSGLTSGDADEFSGDPVRHDSGAILVRME